MSELNANELESVVGGKQHFKPEKDKPGWIQHKVVPHDTLIRTWNPHINPKTNLIVDGEYLWIKKY